MPETRKIVRLAGKDLPGEEKIEHSLCKLKGVNFMMARAVRIKSGFDKSTRLGDLTEEQLKALTRIIEKPHEHNIPGWLMNRRKDISSGIDMHVVESDLMFTHRSDLERMKKMKSYRGIRHMFGLPVRGQRTRSSGRKERTVGVSRKDKKAIAAAAPKKEGK